MQERPNRERFGESREWLRRIHRQAGKLNAGVQLEGVCLVAKKSGLLAVTVLVSAFFFAGGGLAGEMKQGYVDDAACADCHDQQYKEFQASSHGFVGDQRTPGAKMGCQSCHGPGEEHVNQGGGRGVGVTDLSAKGKTDAGKANASCLACHDRKETALWVGSKHERKGMKCASCHSIHGGNAKNLRTARATDTCLSCHKNMKSQMNKFSHHPMKEGRMECSDCHNPHGSSGDSMLHEISVNDQCLSCHAEYRGPFIWEHTPVTENCQTCHTAHGSAHARLLKTRVPYLCQRCHSSNRHPATLYANDPTQLMPSGAIAPTQQNITGRGGPSGGSCLGCHTYIHGSNHPSGKAYVR